MIHPPVPRVLRAGALLVRGARAQPDRRRGPDRRVIVDECHSCTLIATERALVVEVTQSLSLDDREGLGLAPAVRPRDAGEVHALALFKRCSSLGADARSRSRRARGRRNGIEAGAFA